MVHEYAFTPDVFALCNFSSEEVGDLRLSELKESLLKSGLIRDLRGGEWFRSVTGPSVRSRFHRRALELLRKMDEQGRLCSAEPTDGNLPETDLEWCQEAINSDRLVPLKGIITTADSITSLPTAENLARIEKLRTTTWWHGTPSSIELRRCTDDYVNALGTILCHSRSLIFIDPHLNPTQNRYADFHNLLKLCRRTGERPLIEIHRACSNYTNQMIETMFRGTFENQIRRMNLDAEVFVWSKFHDRYLISNLTGILIPNGFDIDDRLTRWTRLEREHSEKVEKEFHPNSSPHKLLHRFSLND